MKFFLNICLTISLLLAIIQLSCGYHISSRVAKGHDASLHIAPYMISLQVIIEDSSRHSCGGAILNENWILTAGHCLIGRNKSEMLIQAGRHNIQLTSEPTEQRRNIDWFKIHEKYGGDVGPNDIALIYVKEPFNWTESVQPIILPKSEKIHSGMSTLYGWGFLDSHGHKFASILQTANIPILPIKQCMDDFPHNAKYMELTNICTFDSTIATSSCSSDSGGPLVQRNMENEMEIIGVVSWGPALCGLPNKSYSVYVRVSSFIDWIENVKTEFLNQ